MNDSARVLRSPVLAWTASRTALRRLALASTVVNVLLVITGGAVRLSGSGLGCPTWPKCTDSSLTPTNGISAHKLIEFGNRQVGIVLGILTLLTLIVAIRRREHVRLAVLCFAIVPVQAVIGGITVRTDLNPWVVSLHFLASMPAIAVTMWLWWQLAERPTDSGTRWGRSYAWVVLAATLLVLMAGTVVTGAGPHAGDVRRDGSLHRNGLSPASMSQLHADFVMILIGLTVGAVVMARYALRDQRLTRAAQVLLGVELAQGVIGYVQYFTHLPSLMVWFHMIGASAVWVAALALLMSTARASNATTRSV